MNTLTSDSIRSLILKHCAESLGASGKTADQIPDEFDLLSGGFVDSLGILQLISAIEQNCQVTVDLEKMDADQLTRIGPLSRFIAEHAVAKSNGQP